MHLEVAHLTTAQRDSLLSPAEGARVFNLDADRYEHYRDGSWRAGLAQEPMEMNAEANKRMTTILADKDAQIAKLEAVLRQIAFGSYSTFEIKTPEANAFAQICDEMQRIAREGLST